MYPISRLFCLLLEVLHTPCYIVFTAFTTFYIFDIYFRIGYKWYIFLWYYINDIIYFMIWYKWYIFLWYYINDIIYFMIWYHHHHHHHHVALVARISLTLSRHSSRSFIALGRSSGQQLYGHLPPITKTIQVRRTRHAGHCWRSRDELISDVLLWIPTHGRAKAGRPARTYIQQLCEDTGCCPEDLIWYKWYIFLWYHINDIIYFMIWYKLYIFLWYYINDII